MARLSGSTAICSKYWLPLLQSNTLTGRANFDSLRLAYNNSVNPPPYISCMAESQMLPTTFKMFKLA